MYRILFALFLIILTTASTVSAGTKSPPACDRLTGEKKALATKILSTSHPYRCCDETIQKCIEKESPCPLALRLANRVCTLVGKGESEEKIKKRLSKRAESMMQGQQSPGFNLNGLQPAGDADAPVQVVVYACARCPFCSKIIPNLYKEVTDGRLKGKVRLFFRAFPLKSHQYSKEGGLAMIAAADLGKFWTFTMYMYNHFDSFSVEKLAEWAAIAGMEKEKFTQRMKAPETRNALVASKKEGLVNGVKATPQLFIDGKKYRGFLDIDELVDIMLEVAETKTGH
jgi:glutaredoxin